MFANAPFTLESVQNAIIAMYTSPDNEVINQAGQYLTCWKNDPNYSFPLAFQFLQMKEIHPNVLFLSLVVLQDFIQNSWDLIDNQTAQNLVSLIVNIINSNAEFADQFHISKLILILCDIILINFDFFQIISQINPSLLLKIFSNLYEIVNCGESFLVNRKIISIAENNLKEKVLFSLNLLNQFDTDSHWFELHYQLLIFLREFKYFYPLLEKVKTAAASFKNLDMQLKLFEEILSWPDLEYFTSDDEIYFQSIIETVINLSNSITFSESGFEDEKFYTYVIYLWDAIFKINSFFSECDKFDFLNAIASQYLSSLQRLTKHSKVFTSSLNNFSEFLAWNEDSDILALLVVAFLDFLSFLIDSGDSYFLDDEIVNCFKTIQRGFEEIVGNYIVERIKRIQANNDDVNESFYFILASTEIGFNKSFAEFSSMSLISMMEKSPGSRISIETTMFFIDKVGSNVQSQEISQKLISLVFELFDKNVTRACNIIFHKYSREHPTLLINFVPRMISILNQGSIQLENACCLVISLYRILPNLIENPSIINFKEVSEFIAMYVGRYLTDVMANFNEENDEPLKNFLFFVKTLLENSPGFLPDEYKMFLFNSISSGLKPALLIKDDEAQSYFCQIFNLFYELGFVLNKESESFIIEWIENIIKIHPYKYHFSLIKYMVNNSPIPFIINFMISYISENEYDEIVDFIINDSVIHEIFLRNRSYFWDAFPPHFLVSLLSLNMTNVMARNAILNMFMDFFNPTEFRDHLVNSVEVSQDFAALTIHALFGSILNIYFEFQIKKAFNIVKLIIDNGILKNDCVVSIFVKFFDPQLPEVDQVVAFFLGQIELDEDQIFKIIKPAVDFFREQRNSS